MKPEPQVDQILSEGFESVSDGGVRAFTVDALSKRLAMSKKTIYKFFPTKENLIHGIMHFALDQINNVFTKVMKEEPNPALQYIKIMEAICKFAGRTPVHKLVELKSLYPHIWEQVESFRLNQQNNFFTILKSAQDQGLARNEIDMRMASIVYVNIVNSTFQPEFFLKNDLPIGETIRGFVKVVARGIFNKKGRVAINQYYEQNRI